MIIFASICLLLAILFAAIFGWIKDHPDAKQLAKFAFLSAWTAFMFSVQGITWRLGTRPTVLVLAWVTLVCTVALAIFFVWVKEADHPDAKQLALFGFLGSCMALMFSLQDATTTLFGAK